MQPTYGRARCEFIQEAGVGNAAHECPCRHLLAELENSDRFRRMCASCESFTRNEGIAPLE